MGRIQIHVQSRLGIRRESGNRDFALQHGGAIDADLHLDLPDRGLCQLLHSRLHRHSLCLSSRPHRRRAVLAIGGGGDHGLYRKRKRGGHLSRVLRGS